MYVIREVGMLANMYCRYVGCSLSRLVLHDLVRACKFLSVSRKECK